MIKCLRWGKLNPDKEEVMLARKAVAFEGWELLVLTEAE